jgi:hypothetical protein
MKKSILVFIFLFPGLVSAQLNNSAFEQRMAVQQADSGKLFLGFNMLGFGKNNEYFDTTVDGYTLLGYQVNPYLSYHVSEKVRLDVGVFAQKDFGNNEYSEVKPTLSLKVVNKNFSFIFGTLESSLNHRLIEPLYDFERVLKNRLENGIQILWIKDDLFLDVWADWQNMIYLNDTEQERFAAGLSFSKSIVKENNFRLDVPVQLVADHRGGQVDVNSAPVITRLNAAVGITAEVRSLSFITAWGVKPYVVAYRSSYEQASFKDGHGVFINPYINTKIGLTVMGSYWKGDQFLTIQGGELYPSISENYPVRVDEVRELYMLRFLYDVKLADGLMLSVRAEPFYDTFAESLEYSYGFYLNFSDRFFLLNAKKNR